MGELKFLEYNVVMKKIVLTLGIFIFLTNSANAQALNMGSIKSMFKKPAETQQSIAKELSTDDSLSSSEQAVVLYNENNIKGSLDILLGIRESERTPLDWLLIGNIFQDQGKISDTIFAYQRAMALNPKFYKPYYNLGNIYLEEEKPYLAIENYRKANKLNNQFPYAYYNLGCAYLRIGKLQKAKIAFLKAIELKNTEPDFHYNLAYTYKKLNNPKLSKQYLGFYNKLMEENQ